MPRVAYNDAALTVWRGKDSLKFIDGLSTNKMVDLRKGEVRQTVFTTTSAKIIDFATVFHMGDFLAIQTHKSCLKHLLEHVLPKILNQDVNIQDVTERNWFWIEYQEKIGQIGTFSVSDGCTRAHISENFSIAVSSLDVKLDLDGTLDEFNEWRIENLVPWVGHEITSKNHPLAAGLAEYVHPAKGCYVGQEILARMVSRKRQGKMLIRVANNDVDEKLITTKGDSHSLAIVRENQYPSNSSS